MAEYEIPDELRYSSEDEWVRLEGERVVVGITDYAQQQLGDVVFVELPEVGAELAAGAAFGEVESVKAVAALYAPLGGVVLEVNDGLADTPERINEDCYGEGWILALRIPDQGEYGALLDAQAYRKHVEARE